MRHWQKNPHTELMDVGSHGISNIPLSLGDGLPPKLAQFQPHLNSYPMPKAMELETENAQLKAKLAQAQVKARPFSIFDPLGLFVQPQPRQQIPQTVQTTMPEVQFRESDKVKQIISTV